MGDCNMTSGTHITRWRIAAGAVVVLTILQGCACSQIPAQAAAIAKQCQAYRGNVCSGIVKYEFLAKEQDTVASMDESVRAALKRVEGKLYECRAAAKRFFCASTFTKCRRMSIRMGVALPPGVVPTLPTLPCKSLCTAYERACQIKDETCAFLADDDGSECNDLVADRAEL